MKPIFGDRAAFIESAKREAAVLKALAAIRTLCAAVGNERFVGKCQFCHRAPYEAENMFPCSHASLYEQSLRGYGLDVLNEAARRFLGVKIDGE